MLSILERKVAYLAELAAYERTLTTDEWNKCRLHAWYQKGERDELVDAYMNKLDELYEKYRPYGKDDL